MSAAPTVQAAAPVRAATAGRPGDRTGRARLVALLRATVAEVAEATLRRCEADLRPPARPRPRRERDLAVLRHGITVHLDIAEEDRDPTDHEEAVLSAYFREAADRSVPLALQLRVTRRAMVTVMGQWWRLAGPAHADDLLALSAGSSRLHHRIERLLVDAYCARLGPPVDERLLHRAQAEAMLSGEVPPSFAGTGPPPAVGWVVLVLPRGGSRPLPPSVLAGAAGVLHTVRDGADVVLVPAEPDGREVAAGCAALAREAGRAAAVAVVADSVAAVPGAYADARRLLRARAMLDDPPALLTVDDALPEHLLSGDEVTAGRLAAVVDALATGPDLVETLAVFLDADLDRGESARRLFVHRRTLTVRLQRISALTGYDPRTTRGVQVLGLALGAYRARPGAG